MRVKLDENVPARVADLLRGHGHDVDSVRAEGLTGEADSVIWRAAQEGGRFLVTQDMDFSDRRVFRPGSHHGILLLRLRDAGRSAVLERVRAILETEDIEHWGRCLVVATDRKIRVVRPSPQS